MYGGGEGYPFFYVKIDNYVTSVFCNVRLLFFALPCIYEKKFVSLRREPTMGSASGGAVVRAAANKSISTDIFECGGAQASQRANKPDTLRACRGAEYVS